MEPDLKNSQVSVKGVYDPAMLVEFVHKRCGKHAVIVKQETEEKKVVEEEAKEEKKAEEGEKENKKSEEGEEENKEKKEEAVGTEAKPQGETEAVIEETKVEAEVKKNEHYYNPPRYGMDLYAYPAYPSYPAHYQAYPPQIFSDENPNACTVM